MRVGYMMNDFGLPLETVQAWAAKEFGTDYPQAAEVIAGCYAAQPEDFGKGSALLARFGNGGGNNDGQDSLFATVEQIEEFLSNHIITRRNLLKDRLEIKRVGENDAKFRYITESDVKTLWVNMSHETRVKLTDIYNVLESDYSTPYNPIREYLFDLPEWTPDKPDYLLELARTVTVDGGDDEQERFALYLKKWLVGMVAAWLDPDVVNHVVLVFIGEQGVYKSTWFNYLPPPALKRYYAIKFDSTNLNKDDLLLLSENIMVCLEEIDTMSDRVANFFKATITATSTNIRAAYGRYAEQRIHVASYCGTGNNPQFLNEAVSRRWLPFVVKHIVSPIDRPFNHEGIFSQALALYKSGFRYWFNTDEIKVLNTHNRNFQAPCLEEELIAMCFRKPGPEECGQFFPTSLVLTHIADNIGSKLNSIKVGRAMKSLGYEFQKSHGIRGWICVPLTPEEMVNNRKRMAMTSGADD
jgi:predicted P-loop ATPase